MDKADEAALVKYAQSLEAEIERLRAALTSIGEFCSDDRFTLGAIARLAEIRDIASGAVNEQKTVKSPGATGAASGEVLDGDQE